ncbi:MAG: class I SAM-dependent methyltransferase [Syntrophales bacterium]
MNCRHCHTPLEYVFLDLGFAPPSNAYLKAEDLTKPELYFPLKLYACTHCWMVQTEDYARADELFTCDYAYFSSVSRSWLDHAVQYTEKITKRLGLNSDSFVIEIASNDGYLLRNFVAINIPCLGIEPTAGTAEAAEKIGIPVLREFFGEALANRLRTDSRLADLIIGNNVYAHVPDINDFTAGLKIALKPGGSITLEFPHLMRLIEQTQFDTVYHEHYSYLSLHTVNRIFETAGLKIFDVEELPTHGGSLRVYGCHTGDTRSQTPAVQELLNEEERQGLRLLTTYRNFQYRAERVKDGLLTFLIEQKRAGKKIAAYGAAAKGNTLLNYAGIKPDLLPYVCDASPSKQGRYLPGSHIPVLPPAALKEDKPDIVVVLPWNIADEIVKQHAYVRAWGGVFVTVVPFMRILS